MRALGLPRGDLRSCGVGAPTVDAALSRRANASSVSRGSAGARGGGSGGGGSKEKEREPADVWRVGDVPSG